jgi:hypothetical protein
MRDDFSDDEGQTWPRSIAPCLSLLAVQAYGRKTPNSMQTLRGSQVPRPANCILFASRSPSVRCNARSSKLTAELRSSCLATFEQCNL